MLLNNPNRPINYYSVWRDRRKNIEKSKKVAEKFGRMKGNAYFCRQKVKNETKNDDNNKLLVVAQLKIRKIVRR